MIAITAEYVRRMEAFGIYNMISALFVKTDGVVIV